MTEEGRDMSSDPWPPRSPARAPAHTEEPKGQDSGQQTAARGPTQARGLFLLPNVIGTTHQFTYTPSPAAPARHSDTKNRSTRAESLRQKPLGSQSLNHLTTWPFTERVPRLLALAMSIYRATLLENLLCRLRLAGKGIRRAFPPIVKT